MSIRIALFLLIGFTFVSCDKLKQTEKDLVGDWKIDSYDYINFEGFTTKFEGSGTLIISDLSSSVGNYALNLSYENSTLSSTKIDSGKIRLNDDAESYTLDRNNSDGTITSLEGCTINFLNKTQLETYFHDEFGGHLLVLHKD